MSNYRPLIFIALNEVNMDLVRKYVAQEPSKYPGFTNLFSRYQRTTTSEEKYEELEPWIQWVSVHTGLTLAEHGIFRLGDIEVGGHKQIFEKLADMSLNVGAVSPMNATNRMRSASYFISDPWTKTTASGPKLLAKLQDALSQTVNDNAKGRITIGSLFILLQALIFFAKPRMMRRYFFLAYGAIKHKWKKAIFLDLLLADVHEKLFLKFKPDFSYLFLNAGAHIQHHYLLSSVFNKNFEAGDTRDRSNKGLDPVEIVFQYYDDILCDLFSLKGVELMVATGLTQLPYRKPAYYYRPKDHRKMLSQLNIDFVSVNPRMTRDFEVTFSCIEDCNEGERRFRGAKVDNHYPLFNTIENRGTTLFVSMDYEKEITPETTYSSGNAKGKLFNLSEDVSFVAVKNGGHDGSGWFFSTKQPDLANGAHVKGIHNEILAYFGAVDGESLQL